MNVFKKNYTFYIYFLIWFSIAIIISEAKKRNSRSHHHHHDSGHSKSTTHRKGSHHHHHNSTHRKSPAHGRVDHHISAQQMCHEYTKQACNENLSRRRLKRSRRSFHVDNSLNHIIGGMPAMPKQYPHMAAVGYNTGNGIGWICGGTLISKNFVLTAAHCAYFSTPQYIRLGELHLSLSTEDVTKADYKVTETHVHPDFNEYQNDIALLKFGGVSSFTAYIRPICLNVDEKIPNRKLFAQGWGETTLDGMESTQLRTVELDQQANAKCERVYGDIFDGRKKLCAGYAPGGKAVCPGDSGGPILFSNNLSECPEVPTYTQVGITSYSTGCGLPDTPAVFTRVSYFIPWIEGIVWKVE